jgi:exoribonuclease R
MLVSKKYQRFQIVGPAGEVHAEFDGAIHAGKALPGDEVRKSDAGCELVKRCEHPPLVGMIEYNSKIKYGYSSRNIPIYLFTPYDTSYPQFLVGMKEKQSMNHIAIVRFEEWNTTTFPRGSLHKVLGPCGQESVELEALAIQYSPWEWTKKRCPERIVSPEHSGREVITAPTIHIDPPGCRDVDDVLSIWSTESGKWTLAISIADVAGFIEQNPKLNFAERIGQTLYENGSAIHPMFEKIITENMLSLSADGIARPAVSLFVSWDGHTLSDFTWKETMVTTTKSYTYENCGSYEELPTLKAIASHILGYDTADSHKWIEALMLLYNTKAAEILKERGQGLLRIHSEPDAEKLAKYKGLGLPAEELAYPAAIYCSASAPESANGHWGLSYSVYCHASSPIRRFADCVNQAVLKAAIQKRGDFVPAKTAETMAYELNCLSKNAKKYERDYFFAKQVLTAKKNEYLEGIIVDIEKVYIYEWKRIVNVESAIIPGTEVHVEYYANMSQRNWKSRILFALK